MPLKTRFGAWPARVAARRALREAMGRAGVDPRVPGPARSVSAGGPYHSGSALRWVHEGEVLEVTLHRAPCNEIGLTMLAELEELAAYVRAGAGGAKALLMHSAIDRGFSAGADLRELHAGLFARAAEGASTLAVAREVRGFLDRIHAVMDTLDQAPITTVAAVHGVVFGGGFELALTADVIVADKSARFAFPELRLGLVPGFGGIPRLRRDVGNAVVRDLLLTGRSLNASRAHAIGLVSQVVGRGKALQAARGVATQATRFEAETARLAKRFAKPLPRAELEREKDLFVEMLGRPVVREALTKFVESDDVRPYLP
ncbi:MAG: enoyl-CoA hydratase/isomerase family protein [Myxococcota bacterium]